MAVVEQKSGHIIGLLEFTNGVSEVYDVQVIPGVRRAGLQNLLSKDRYVAVDTPNAAFWTQRTDNDVHHSHDIVQTGHYHVSVNMIDAPS